MHARIQIYWCRSSIFRHLFVSFYGYVHWRMTTEISVMYGSEKVKGLYLYITPLTMTEWIGVQPQFAYYYKNPGKQIEKNYSFCVTCVWNYIPTFDPQDVARRYNPLNVQRTIHYHVHLLHIGIPRSCTLSFPPSFSNVSNWNVGHFIKQITTT